MSFSHIQSKLAALGSIVNGKEIVIDQIFSGSLELSTLLEDAFGNKVLTLKGHFLESDTTYFRITGYTDLLEHQNWEFDLRVTETEAGYSFILKLLLPGGWKFSDSFQELPLIEVTEEGGAECLVDTFQFSTARLIFSNVYAYDESLEMDLVAGLNFKGQALFRGKTNFYLGMLGLDNPLIMYGPVKEYLFPADPEHFMGIRLQVDLPLVGDFGSVNVTRSGFLLRSPLRAADLGFYSSLVGGPGLFFFADLELGGRPLSLLANYDPNYSETLNFRGVFTDFNISGLSTLDSTMGGGLDSQVPSELGSLSGIRITEFGFGFDLSSRSLSSLSLGVGCANTWTLIPDWLTLSEIGLGFEISYPFNASKRAIEVGVQALLNIQQTSLAVALSYPSLNFRLEKADDNPLSLTGLITHFASGLGDLPAVNVDFLNVVGNATRRQLAFHLQLSELLEVQVGATTLRVDEAVFYAKLEKGGSQSAFIRTELSLGSMAASLFANIGPGPLLSGTFSNVSLHALYSEITGNIDIPEELPHVTFDYVNVMYDYVKGDFNLFASASIAYDKLPFDSAITSTINFNFNKSLNQANQTEYALLINISGSGPLSFADGFVLNEFALNFEYGSVAGWSLTGDFKTILCDQAVNLTASYTSNDSLRRLSLSAIAPQPITLLGYQGLFALEWSRLTLSIAKVDPEGGQARKEWTLRLDALLRIPDIANVGGALEIYSDGQGKKGLKFKPSGLDTYHFDIADGIGINFLPKEVAVSKDSADASWKLVGSAYFGITGIPGSLGRAMPESFIAELSLGKTATKLELISPLAPLDFPLPNADGKSLGKFVFEVRKIGIALRPKVGLSAQLGLGFPKELDDYFGGDIFRVYQAGDPLSMCLIDTTVSGTGIDLKFVTTPFLSGNTSKIQGEDWMHFDFGEYGQIGMLMPSFKYNMGSQYFEAAGGFKIEKPLFLPLSPLHNFLDAVGMGAAKAIFPDKLPVKGFSLVDDNDNLKTEELINFLGDIPDEAANALRGAGNLLNRLPDDFKSYLRLEIPTELTFKFGFAPSGRVSLALNAPNEPIRFLYPGVVQGLVPMPGLIGIELHKLGIGTLASGSLFFGEIDAVIDMYDLPALVASLALPTNPGFPLPTSDELRRRILLRDVWALVPLSQGVPVPVPVFYDELGFEYKGLEGVGLQLHLGVPQPDFAAGGTALVSAIGNFLKTRNARLDPNTPPGGQDLRFRFHDEYLEAPEYLGGAKIGTSGKVIEVGTWKYVAQMLNFTKHFLLSDLIAAIPVENRMLNTTQKLAFFSFEATALISTPEEFDGGAYTQLQLSAAQAADFRTVLPGVQTSSNGAGNGSTGLIAFLRGAVKMSIFELTASLGIAGSDSMGFGTGFKLAGKVGGFLDAELSGALLLNAPKLEDHPISYPAVEQVALPVIAQVGETCPPSAYIAHVMGDGKGVFRSPDVAQLRTPQFTYECWVKIATPASSGRYILLGREGQLELFFNKMGALTLFLDTAAGHMEVVRTANNTLKFNTWTHFAVVSNGKTLSLSMYGAPLQHVDLSKHTFNAEPGSFHLGRSYSGTGISSAPVQFSDLRIWKAALIADHQAIYRRTRLQGNERDLVAYYRFDIPALAGRVADQAMGLHGTLSQASTVASDLNLYAWLRWPAGAAVAMRNIDCVGSANFTVSVVMRLAKLPQAGKRMRLLGSARKRAYFTPNAAQLSTVTLNTFFVVTQVLSDSTRKTFINNNLISTEQISITAVTADPLFLNMYAFGEADGVVENPFEVAEVSIWNDSRSDEWVQQNWGARRVGNEAGLAALYRPAHHDMGKIHNLVQADRAGMVQWPDFSANFQPAGVSFDAATQYGHVPQTDKLNLSTYSICFWFRPESNTPTEGTGRANPVTMDLGPRVAWLNGTLYHRWHDASGTLVDWGIQHANLTLDEWHFIAMTNDGKTATIWLNGTKIAENVHNKGIKAGASGLVIGRRDQAGPAGAFKGKVDNLSIWNRVLSINDIKYWRWVVPGANTTNLVACYPLSAEDGGLLRDVGPHGLHGQLHNAGGGQGMPATTLATSTERMAIQALGHTHLRIGGHEVMRADMRMNDEEFWFKGKLNLFPDSWGVKVAGDAEGLIRKDSLYLDATTSINLHGLQLLSSHTRITHERAILTGKWLGLETLLDIQWAGGDPHFSGYAGTQFNRTFELGAIYIDGIKVSDNFKISLDVDVHFGFDFDKTGFGCDARCRFKINGMGFDESFVLKVAIRDIEELAAILRQALIDAPKRFFAHIFASALAYLENVYGQVVEFWEDTTAQAGQALQHAYDVSVDALAGLAQQAGLTVVQLGGLLHTGYQQSIDQIGGFLTSAGYDIVDVAAGLAQGAGATLNEVGQVLNAAGHDVAAISEGLVHGANATIADVGNVLESLGKTPEQIAGGLQSVGASLQTITNTLQDLGSTVEQVTSAIASIGAATDQLGTLLKNTGFNHKDICKGMNALGKSVQDIANSLKRALFDEKAIADGLFYIGKAGEEIGAALKYVGYGIDQVSQAFKDLGKDAETLMRSLKHAFGTQWQTFTNRLKALDYPLSHITRALDIWCSDSEVARYLKGAGVGLYDIAVLLKNTLGAGYSTCYDILVDIGYSATEVTKVLLNVF